MSELRIAVAGDVIPTQPLPSDDELPDAQRAALTELRDADLAFASLETAFTDCGTPWDKLVTFRSDPALARDVAAMGLDVVSLANNQTMNYGYEGLAQTMRELDAVGVRHAGAGGNAEQAWAPTVVEAACTRVALVAFTCVAPSGWAATSVRGGLAVLHVRTSYEPQASRLDEEPGLPPRVHTWLEHDELAVARRAVEQAAAQADLVLVAVHWGVGSQSTRADYQEQLADALVAAGADAVLGGHPPALQGIELRDGALVSFSQGTFVRQQPQATGDPALDALYAAMPRESCLLRLHVEAGRVRAASVLPAVLDVDGRAGIVSGVRAHAVLEQVAARSRTLAASADPLAETLRLEIPSKMTAK